MRKFLKGSFFLLLVSLLLVACQNKSDELVIEKIGPSYEKAAESADEARQGQTTDSKKVVDEEEVDQNEVSQDNFDENKQNLMDEENNDVNVDFETAVNTFIESFERYNISISEVRFIQEDEDLFYQIFGWDGENHYRGKVDAKTGDVYEEDYENNVNQLGYITLEEIIIPQDAMQFALEESDTEKAVEWILFADANGYPIYKINIVGGEDQYIQAANGSVLSPEELNTEEVDSGQVDQ